MRGRRSLVFVLAMCAFWAPAAHAGTITLGSSSLTFTASPGEVNKITVNKEISDCGSLDYPCIEVDDAVGVGISIPAGCEHVLATSYWAVCPLVTTVAVNLGDGNDTYDGYDNFASMVSGGEGDDVIDPGVGNDVVDGGPGNDEVTGDIGNDVVRGGPGNDKLEGNYSQGDPVSVGTDTLSGGDGFDQVIYYQRGDDMNVSLDGIANDGAAGENDNIQTDVESVTTGTGDDVLTGNDAANTLDGHWGNDVIQGQGGNDTIDGSDGNDQLFGDAGDDTIHGGGANDKVTGGPGHDSLFGDESCSAVSCFGGNDEIFAQDRTVDQIGCGIAGDIAHVDWNDVLAADPVELCESVDRTSACVVPKVRGKKLRAAKAAIRRAHCAVGKVKKKASRVPVGRVILQRPAPGKRLAPGTRINLVVSRGR